MTTAILPRCTTGADRRGQWIDVVLFDAQLGWLANGPRNYLVSGEPRGVMAATRIPISRLTTFPTADGRIARGIGSDAQWRRFCVR